MHLGGTFVAANDSDAPPLAHIHHHYTADHTSSTGGYMVNPQWTCCSGCYYLRLLYTYWKANPEAASKHLRKSNIQRAAQVLVDVWRAEQRHEEDIPAQGRPLYRRPRVEGAKGKPWTGSTGMPRDGKGSPVSFTGNIHLLASADPAMPQLTM